MYTFDDSGPEGRTPSIMGFVVGDSARYWSGKDPSLLHRAFQMQLEFEFGDPAARESIGFISKDWNAEEWSGGCYVGYMSPSNLMAYGRTLSAPEGRIFFAGTESADEWVGYMDGAIRAGVRAASEAARAVTGSNLPVVVFSPSKLYPPASFELRTIEKVLPSLPQCFLLIALLSVVVGLLASAHFKN